MNRSDITPAIIRLMSAEDRKALGYDHNPCSPIPDPKPERDQTPALGKTVSGETKGFRGSTVCFVLYRVRPLDPDNAAGSVKDLLDGLRHANLISGDEWWRIKLAVEQVRVESFKQEKTVIQITDRWG